MYNMFAKRIDPIGRSAEAFGTENFVLVEPVTGLRLVIARLTILCSTTAQTLTIMKPSAKVKASAAALASQKVLDISADPGSIAANDYCVVRLADGTFQLNMVASVDSLEITFTDNFTAAIDLGADVFFMGTSSDGHAQYVITASTENEWESEIGAFVSNDIGYPIVIHTTNATVACIVQGGTALYVNG